MTFISVPDYMKLRPVEDADHQWLVELHNDPEVLNNTRDPRPITIENHLKWWDSIKNNPKEIRLIFVVNDERVGFTKFYAMDAYNKHCVLGADIHQKNRGYGFAKFMWTLMLQKCFDEINLNRVGLSTMDYNVVAKHVYLNLGFNIEGYIKHCHYRDGKFYDAISMYMLREQWQNRNA